MADSVERCPGNSYQTNVSHDLKQEMQVKHKFRETRRLIRVLHGGCKSSASTISQGPLPHHIGLCDRSGNGDLPKVSDLASMTELETILLLLPHACLLSHIAPKNSKRANKAAVLDKGPELVAT